MTAVQPVPTADATRTFVVTFTGGRIARHLEVPPWQVPAASLAELTVALREKVRPFLFAFYVDVVLAALPDGTVTGFVMSGQYIVGRFVVLEAP